jgi:DNA polymerase-3 subunit epsilon
MICFIDFETSGIDVFKDYPIEFGAVLVDDELNIIKEFHSYINPERKRKISSAALKIHGLTPEFLTNMPNSMEVISSFFTEMGCDYKLAGWNISFDVVFLRKMAHQNSMMREFNKINYRHLDIQSISYLYNKINANSIEKNSLDSMCKMFNLKRNDKHNALDDAKLTFEIYKRIISTI